MEKYFLMLHFWLLLLLFVYMSYAIFALCLICDSLCLELILYTRSENNSISVEVGLFMY